MELGLVKLAARLFGTESDGLQGAADAQVTGFWQIITFSYCIFDFVIVNTPRFHW